MFLFLFQVLEKNVRYRRVASSLINKNLDTSNSYDSSDNNNQTDKLINIPYEPIERHPRHIESFPKPSGFNERYNPVSGFRKNEFRLVNRPIMTNSRHKRSTKHQKSKKSRKPVTFMHVGRRPSLRRYTRSEKYEINQERQKRSSLMREPLVRREQTPVSIVPYFCHKIPCHQTNGLPPVKGENTGDRYQLPNVRFESNNIDPNNFINYNSCVI